MGFDVHPLPSELDFGLEIRGLDVASLELTEVWRELRRLWAERGLLVFRDMHGSDVHMRLAWTMGEPGEHPMQRTSASDRAIRPAAVSFDKDKGSDLYVVDGETLGAHQPWHVDWIYMDEIARGGMMRAVTLPSVGGETGFIDQAGAYDALPPEMADRIAGLNVLYRFYPDASQIKFGKRPERSLNVSERLIGAMDHERVSRRSVHPMVFRHPETGRRVLNVSQWFADAVEGMDNASGEALLAQIIEHSIDPVRAYWHSWRPGDILLWDNWRMMHASRGVPIGEVRHMERIDIVGDYGLGRYEHARPGP